MKVRNGFVSNSSSSSFVCNICGETEGGYDCSLDEVGMAECEHGHIFHKSHADKDFFEDSTREEKYKALKKYFSKYYNGYGVNKLEKDYNNVDMDDEEFAEKYNADLADVVCDCGVPEEYCPVCAKIKEYEKDEDWKKYQELKIKFSDICLETL